MRCMYCGKPAGDDSRCEAHALPSQVKPIEQLKELLASGEFHHATYRNQGTLWEGLHIYRKKEDGFLGYTHSGIIFGKNDPDLEEAYQLVRHTGVSVGAYGSG
jgi:hypothetical protein